MICKYWAAKAWLESHNTSQNALAHIMRQLQLSVVDNDSHLRRNYSHLTSHKRGDLAGNAQSTDFQILSSGNLPSCLDHLLSLMSISVLWLISRDTGVVTSTLSRTPTLTICLPRRKMPKSPNTPPTMKTLALILFPLLPLVSGCSVPRLRDCSWLLPPSSCVNMKLGVRLVALILFLMSLQGPNFALYASDRALPGLVMPLPALLFNAF
jgi:hypothetical protein